MRRFLAGAGFVALSLFVGSVWHARSGSTSSPGLYQAGTLAAPPSPVARGAFAPAALPLASQGSDPSLLPSRAALTSATRGDTASVATRFNLAADLKAFADELLAREERLSREERYFLAKVLETCGFALAMNDDLFATAEKRRREFLQTLVSTDPEYARRVAAYDAADDTARCRRFQGSTIAQAKVDELYRSAGDAGDPRAQARLLVAELSKALAIPKNALESSRFVEQDQLQRIVSLLASRDGEAIVTVAQILAEHRLIEQLRMGPTGEAPSPAPFVGALMLVACDFQPSCSVFDREALLACAHAGYCAAGSYEELYSSFLASPFAWSIASRYRELIHTAIETRNWSLIGLHKLIGARAKARR